MNILILKSYGIGNVLMMTPMIRALHEKGHKIFLMYDAGPLGGPTKELIGGLECIEDMIAFDVSKESTGDRFIKWVSDIKPDLAIQSYPGDTLFDWLYQYLECEIRMAPKPEEITKHESEYNMDIVQDLVGDDYSLLYEVPGSNLDGSGTSEEAQVNKWLERAGEKRIVVLCPSFKKEGKWQVKNWGVGNYAELGRLLDERGFQPVLVDGADGIGVCNIISYFCPQAINLAGLTTIKQTKYVFEKAFAVVGNDCGPSHLAAGLGKPTLAIFGPTSVTCKQPMGKDVIILKTGLEHDTCVPEANWNGCFCITQLKPQMVMKVLLNMVAGEYEPEEEEELVGSENG